MFDNDKLVRHKEFGLGIIYECNRIKTNTIEESIFRELIFIGESCNKNCSKTTKTDCKLHRPVGIILRDGKKHIV